MPRNQTADTYLPYVLRNCQTAFTLYFHQEYMKIPVAPHPHHHLVLSVFLILDIPVVALECLIVSLLCISLKTDDIEHLFV